MIPFDFEYYRPATIFEAVDTFINLDSLGKKCVYYGGGSELISMSRLGNLYFDAVIDIKGIDECRALYLDEKNLILGSGLTLLEILESNLFPLLSKCAGRVADHTMQCKITLGGNVASSVIYHETVLPFFLTDAGVTIAQKSGLNKYSIAELFTNRLNISKEQLIISFTVDKKFLSLPYFHIKKTKSEKIDYPLITLAAIKENNLLKIAFSGLRSFPFRDLTIEKILNDANLAFEQRAKNVINYLGDAVADDYIASSQYRKFVLSNMIIEILNKTKDL